MTKHVALPIPEAPGINLALWQRLRVALLNAGHDPSFESNPQKFGVNRCLYLSPHDCTALYDFIETIVPSGNPVLKQPRAESSILTHRGLVYGDGRVEPADHEKTLFGEKAKATGNYHVLPDGTAFSMIVGCVESNPGEASGVTCNG